jgi:hypothetical protein
VFAPKGARIVRQLLFDPKQGHSQRELSQITGLNEGYTSRIVRRPEELHFREDARGANTWLVVSNDKGVFHGSSDQDGIVCVVYLDLKGHPERAKEAASMVRQEKLKCPSCSKTITILGQPFLNLV